MAELIIKSAMTEYNEKYERSIESLINILKISRFEAVEILDGLIELFKNGFMTSTEQDFFKSKGIK